MQVHFIDDLGEPTDDGRYVTLRATGHGKRLVVLVLTTENFYAALGKVIEATLPGGGVERVH